MKGKRRQDRQELMGRIDRVCARMNGALAAVAIALAVLVTLTAAVRAPALLSFNTTTQDSAD
jgi:hypothetical protein